MTTLTQTLNAKVRASFEALGLDPALGVAVPSDRPDLSHFQCNGAMSAAKLARMNPRAIASAVARNLQADSFFSRVSVDGPGFINLSVSDDALAARLQVVLADERLGVDLVANPEKVVIDFGGPNIAKPMHVGHLRSLIIGDTLQRLFRFLGHQVVSDVHLGDWGTQMGMLIREIQRREPALPYFDNNASGPYPEHSPVGVHELAEIYPVASARAKADPDEMEHARAATAALQRGHPGYRALWQHLVDESRSELERDFQSLGVKFDLWRGESSVNDRIPAMIAELRSQGHAILSEGALVVPLEHKESPPFLLQKSDGSAIYATTDLATLVERIRNLGANRILYVVDKRQTLHFEQLFEVANRTQIAGSTVLEHIGFGTVNGTDGKPFKTRAGGVLRLSELLSMATDHASRRIGEARAASTGSNIDESLAHAVAIAAVKFADLSHERTSNYVFDLAKFVSFEGHTGPYLLYAAVRMQAILQKAKTLRQFPGLACPPADAVERDLLLSILCLPDAIAAAYSLRAPHLLCDYAYRLTTQFSGFYQRHHVLREVDSNLRASRLSLVDASLRSLRLVLDLLGIEVPNRM